MGAPWLSHLTLVCGGRRDMPLSTISTVIASSDSVMAGGTHVLVSRALQGELEEDEALDLKHALIGGFGDSALELARGEPLQAWALEWCQASMRSHGGIPLAASAARMPLSNLLTGA